MNSSGLVYNLITMKKTILLLTLVGLFSGCASYKFTKKYYSNEDPVNIYKGGVIHYGIKQDHFQNMGELKINQILSEFCNGREVKRISTELAPENVVFLIIPLKFYEYKTEFECIDEKK
jgi:hypothetical protein